MMIVYLYHSAYCFLSGVVIDLVIQIVLLTWMPTPDEEYVLYILAAMWGFTDGIWQTQINGNIIFVATLDYGNARYH